MTKPYRSTALGFVFALMAVTAAAQTAATPSPAVQASSSSSDAGSTRPATPTYYGDTGLWFVPTGETLPKKKFSFSVFRSNEERSQGLTDIANIGLTLGAGLTDRIEV